MNRAPRIRNLECLNKRHKLPHHATKKTTPEHPTAGTGVGVDGCADHGEEVSSADWKQRAADSLGISQSRFYDFQAEATSKELVIQVSRGRYRRPAA